MKSLVAALAFVVLPLVPMTARADLAPEPEKKDGCEVATDGPGAVAMLGALVVIGVAARRRARA